MMNDYWLLLKRNASAHDYSAGLISPGVTLPSACIIEWTQDELVYVWPVRPQFESLCGVCNHVSQQSPQICNTDVKPGYPCSFDAVPETAVSQDFDDFMIDGDSLSECGYFHSFSDFAKEHGLSQDAYFFCNLGIFSSIREARHSLKDASGFPKM